MFQSEIPIEERIARKLIRAAVTEEDLSKAYKRTETTCQWRAYHAHRLG